MALTKAHNRMIEGAPINVRDYGAKGDGTTDDTAAIQAAIDSGAFTVHFPAGVYKVTSIVIEDTRIKLVGEGSKHLYDRISTEITLAQVQQLGGSWIYQSSSSDIAINLKATSFVVGGVHIEGLCFYQEHASYVTPTAYPACIDDTGSTSYFSGMTLKDLMFINCYQGIDLTHVERADITDINGDFYWKGIYLNNTSDVCKLERIHIWNFGRSTDGAAFRQSLSSSWGIHLDDIDEAFVNDIFIWDRLYGIKLANYWGSLDGYTADAVGLALVIENPRGFGVTCSNIKINSCNANAVVDYAVGIIGTPGTSVTSVSLNNVSIWKGSNYTNAYNDGIYIGTDDLRVHINGLMLKYFIENGVNVQGASDVIVNNCSFMGAIPNQGATAYTLATVGFRVENSGANVKLTNIDSGVMKYIYDGYWANVTFDNAPSVIDTSATLSIASVTSVTGSTSPEFGNKVAVTGSGTSTGPRKIGYGVRNQQFVSGRKYTMGLVYGTTAGVTHLSSTDWRTFGASGPNSVALFIPMNPTADANIKLVLMIWTATSSGPATTGFASLNFTGTFDYYASFACEGDFVATPDKITSGRQEGTSSAIPSATYSYYNVGDRYYNTAPSVDGNNMVLDHWVCTASGSPGTWVPQYLSTVSPAT